MKTTTLASCLLLSASTLLSCQEQFDKRLAREAQEYTSKHCPQQAEEGTTLDSLTYNLDSRIYTMWYTLDKANEVVFKANEPVIHYELVQRILTDDNTKSIREHSVIFRFVYRSSSSHKFIYQTTVTPQEYGKQ